MTKSIHRENPGLVKIYFGNKTSNIISLSSDYSPDVLEVEVPSVENFLDQLENYTWLSISTEKGAKYINSERICWIEVINY